MHANLCCRGERAAGRHVEPAHVAARPARERARPRDVWGVAVWAGAMWPRHPSPLDPPGGGDAGGMNVYVLELSRRLAASGVEVDVFTRAPPSRLPPGGGGGAGR